VLQVVGTFVDGPLPVWAVVLYQAVTMLSYTNSAVNPFLYAFLTDNFRRTLAESFQRGSRSASSSLVARGLAICSNALYVSVQSSVLLLPPADRPARHAAAPPTSVPAEGPRDDDDRVMSVSWRQERGNQSSSIELHDVLDDDDTISGH